MLTFDSLYDHFQFLLIEVKNLACNTFDFLNDPTPELLETITSKDDSIDNLRNMVENACFEKISSSSNGSLSRQDVNSIRAIQTIAVNLERIADFCVNIVRQVHYLTDTSFLYSFNYEDMLTEILDTLAEIDPALKDQDLSKTLTICRAENNLDKMYKTHFDRVMSELQKGCSEPGNYITILFIVRYLERIGDSLLNIGEAILFTILGEKIKINQFQALQQTLSQSEDQPSFSDVNVQFIWGTRSGCRIGRVEDKKERSQIQDSIFKEGSRQKILQERENLLRWERTFPGLVPRIFNYFEHETDDQASMLVELLPGCTLDEAILTTDWDTLLNAAFILEETLKEVWSTTQSPGPVATNFMDQLSSRLGAVKQVHPSFERKSSKVGSNQVLSSRKLIADCSELEAEVMAPFSVLIHGDFNINNIVYNHSRQKVHFIDVHRSRSFDYVQDVSVFLVSNYRIPLFDKDKRDRLNWMIQRVLLFAKAYARDNEDRTFDARLALAVARSLYTSTRFELNSGFARDMYLRAHYLLDKMVHHRPLSWDQFSFPKRILQY
jgi:phosphate uptake regulator